MAGAVEEMVIPGAISAGVGIVRRVLDAQDFKAGRKATGTGGGMFHPNANKAVIGLAVGGLAVEFFLPKYKTYAKAVSAPALAYVAEMLAGPAIDQAMGVTRAQFGDTVAWTPAGAMASNGGRRTVVLPQDSYQVR